MDLCYTQIMAIALKEIVTDSNVHEALLVLIQHQEDPALQWCVNYAKYGLACTGEELNVQLLYVLNNVAQWKGADARACKIVLRSYVQQRGKKGWR
jgi:hypothetical protein